MMDIRVFVAGMEAVVVVDTSPHTGTRVRRVGKYSNRRGELYRLSLTDNGQAEEREAAGWNYKDRQTYRSAGHFQAGR